MTGPYFESWSHENLVKFAKEAYDKLQKQGAAMSIDAMKQALEYTRPGAIVPVTPETVKILVDALRLAIEQAERQESYWQEEARRYAGNADFWREKAKRQPLTDEEIEQATGCARNKPLWLAIENVARAIERAHGIGGPQ
jgi:hypothetical protein